MELLDSNEPASSVQEARLRYARAQVTDTLTDDVQFSYIYALLRTDDKTNLDLAVNLIENLFKTTKAESNKRTCLFYLAVANAKLRNYEKSLQCCENILKIQPGNQQTLQLQGELERRTKKDGLIGVAVVGVAVLGGLAALALGLGVGLSQKNKKNDNN